MNKKIAVLFLFILFARDAISACTQPFPTGGNWYYPSALVYYRQLTQDPAEIYDIFDRYSALEYPNERWYRNFSRGSECYVRYTLNGELIIDQYGDSLCWRVRAYGWGQICPAGYFVSDTSCYPRDTSNNVCPTNQTKFSPPQFCPVGNPINQATGSKLLAQTDSDLSNILGFEFKRFYQRNYDDSTLNSGYALWGHTFGRSLSFVRSDATSSPTAVIVKRDEGRKYSFNVLSGVYVSEGLFKHTLSYSISTGEYQFYDQENDLVEFYGTGGRLIRVVEKSGRTKYFTYLDPDGNKYPSSAPSCGLSSNFDPINPVFRGVVLGCITNDLGAQLNIQYNTYGLISGLVNPRGSKVSYSHVRVLYSDAYLSTAIYPDSSTRQYLYGEPAYVSSSPSSGIYYGHALTGIIDENNSRYATYTYNSAGFASTTEHAGGVDKRTVNYSTNSYGNITSSSVTDSRGATVAYGFDTVDGNVKVANQSQPAGSGCAASASSLTYDANGNVASRVDFNGNKTTYVYDLARNTETSRTEGLTTAGAATAATRTTTTSWHATWRLPLVVSVYTGATASGTPVQRTTYTYDTKGNITSVLEEDPVRALSRTTTTTYTYSSVVPGLVLQKVVDGPRTDVTDTTIYEYYPHDATCTASTATPIVDPITGVAPPNYGCRGQLKKVTNAAGHITNYDRYNHHGQLEQMTDANSLVTQQTYDLRQRLLTRVVSGSGITTQTTQLTYDNVGQITQLKMPDNSTLNYTYDAAHRLTDIEDTLGNKVHYTLDTEGNRTQEDVYDPNNALSTTLTRSFDALNRLQTQTGL